MNSWNPTEIDDLCTRLCRTARLPTAHRREPIRVWALSGVERLHLPDRTAILKYARAPFTTEAYALAALANSTLAVPQLYAAETHHAVAGILMADLGPATRQPQTADIAAVAAQIHTTDPIPALPVVNSQTLREGPQRCAALVDQAHGTGLLHDPGPLYASLTRLEQVATKRAAGADVPPYGTCHGELHPSAIHITGAGRYVLDLALVHTGPGLLDLASWLGAKGPGDTAAMNELITAYVHAGGDSRAHATRGGIGPARWALGWHRVLSALWHLRQLHDHITDDADFHQRVATLQLAAAADLLR